MALKRKLVRHRHWRGFWFENLNLASLGVNTDHGSDGCYGITTTILWFSTNVPLMNLYFYDHNIAQNRVLALVQSSSSMVLNNKLYH